MDSGQVHKEIAALPSDAQKQVSDFVAFLHQQYGKPRTAKSTNKIDLSRESFVGMWSDREDMQDSAEWVRNHRNREWQR